MVRQILFFSRPHEQKRQPLHLHLIVQEVVRFLQVSLPSTIEIRQHVNKHAGMILADPTQLHQVLMNLCVNAEYAMRDTGNLLEIRIDAVAADDAPVEQYPILERRPYVRLSVRDTGFGMPPEVAEKIFDPFFTTKPTGEGTGMGLAVVHGIITHHNGIITVDSTPGVGTTFTIYLPQIRETTKDAAATLDPTTSHRTGCLLWVDDEAALASLNQALLKRYGYDVVTHTHSDAARDTFRADPHRFDLVITNQTMPRMTGEKLVQELRRIRPDIPIILCTGFSHVMSAEKARALGIDAFLMKPALTRDWVATIERVLDQSNSRQGR
jgi:CheY-like chemotaxis protein